MMRACRPHCRPSVSCLPPPERSRPVPPSAEEYVPPPTRLPYRGRQPNPTTVHKLVGAAAAAVLCKFSTATCTAWEGGRSKRGGGGSRNVCSPLFFFHTYMSKTGSGNRATCSARQRQRQRKRQHPPHVQCMYEIYVSCLGRAGLGWLGSHNDNDNDTNKLRSS